jgi:hypothetical protein
MTLGRDVGLREVSQLSLHALVGRFNYWSLAAKDILQWVEEVWKPLFGYTPVVYTLVKGWFCFCLKSSEDATDFNGKGLDI